MPTMPYVVRRGADRYELRESSLTPRGPRSRTLASFRELTPEVINHALGRSSSGLSAGDVRRAARRAGAPVAPAPADGAAATLLSELDHQRPPGGRLGLVLEAALAERTPAGAEPPSDAERSAAPWLAAGMERRSHALRDLLLLTDALPASRTGPLEFPPLRRAPA